MRNVTRRRAPQRGQALAEFAIILVVLMLLLLGIVDLSRAVYIRSVVANAAREGARYGIIYPMNEDAGDRPDPDNIMYHVRSSLG